MNPLFPLQVVLTALSVVLVVSILRSLRVVPAKSVLVIERLGKYAKTLHAGFHILVPFLDRVAYTHSLKEQAIDVPTQPCFTWDNVKVDVDGVLYYRVVDPKKASYGITNYEYATVQLAQTTMRSVIGKLELDKTFEERDSINAAIVAEVDAAGSAWGVEVTRYEIQNIDVPSEILQAMEAQLRAEREKRGQIARSLGEMESKINHSVGEMEESINRSEGEKEKWINEAEGQAAEIRALASATAASLREIAKALEAPSGDEALSLQLAEQYLGELRHLARKETQVILPLNLTDMEGVLDSVRALIKS
ncbi:Regulator of protease activity HflC, stomatin/prohibitin superfamily [Alkalispirochaeta americana]|uniref:Regulator of protease activity HflC, stomatin/prohibitin superfamily n=1 Tax=Alkalispirochaeta americana TaxID=159291 RepID=A0A1N6QAC7_9SPIO|nr:stomatin-like protein [Alkalispirochaeta americana]SIQ13527.1 Regulator of protease activity HflC, stomatin/prohibitin superfamily [Alkalispirochaeta americana]